MRILASALCDHAEVLPDGKVAIRGMFHDLYTSGFPARQDRMTLVLTLEWDRSDSGNYSFRVDLCSPGGKAVLTLEVQSDVTPRPAGRPPARTRMLLPLTDVVFPRPGRYSFRLTAKGRRMEGPVLYLVEQGAEG